MKKIIAILLTIPMLFLMPTGASSASFSDTTGKSCETAVTVLSALGILEGKAEGAFEPDSPLTRAEMTTIILRTMNMTGMTGSDTFADVPTDHWAYANISAAYQMGIINGTSAATFEPDKSVTYEQAVKMMIAALGYTVKAEAEGGYPSGYLAQASQLDILKGVKVGGEMSRGDMAILVYNALDTELFIRSLYGDAALEFETNKAKTLLSYYLKVSRLTAEITATPMGEIIDPGKKLKNDEVAVGTVIMKKGETAAQEMLGMRIDIFTREDGETEKPVILAVVPRSNTKVMDLRVSDIEIQSTEITYETESGTDRKVNIAGAKLIYNGRVETNKTYLENMQCGTVRLIANEGGDCKYVIAEEYKNYVVDRILAEENKIYFKNQGVAPMILDLTESGNVLTNAAGIPLTLAELIEWDVLSVIESVDKSVRRIYSSFQSVTGTVTEMREGEVVIGDKTYAVASPLAVGEIKIGITAAFCLDYSGAIAALDEAASKTAKYGWLVGAANTKGINTVPQLKLFTEDGTMVVFNTSDKVTLNGTPVLKTELLNKTTLSGTARFTPDAKSPLVDDTGNVVPQLLKYETTEEGFLCRIETATNKSNPVPDDKTTSYGDGDFSMDWYVKSPARGQVNSTEFNGEPDGSANRFSGVIECINGVYFGNVRTDGETKCFIIPYAQDKEEEYKIRSMASFSLENARTDRNIAFYDIDEEFHCGAMVIHSYLGSGASGDYPDQYQKVGIVLGRAETLSEDGEVLDTLKLYTQDGEEVSVSIEEDTNVLYANAASDIVADTKWYATNGRDNTPLENIVREKYKKRYKSSDSDADFPTEPLGALPMYLKMDDLTPGDVVQYETNPVGEITRIAVQFRCEYPAQMELFQKADCDIYDPPTKVLQYTTGGKVRTNGIVKKTVTGAILVETYSALTTGILRETPFLRALPNKGVYVLWDLKKGEMRKIALQDIMEGDEIFSYWANTDQKITVVYRNRTK
ncbi:MAG: S-layer homology domain-containing protein [Clostridia bacterium]|nr:S-layer homology domain-containing protein [Clostridia bacterium]